jgi:hypothetical protein
MGRGTDMSIRNNGRRKRTAKRRFQVSFDKSMKDAKSVLALNVEQAAEIFFTKHLLEQEPEDRESAIADVYVLDRCLWWIVVDSALILDVSVVRVKLL